MSNKSNENGHPFLPDLKGKAFRPSPVIMVIVVGFLYVFFIIDKGSFLLFSIWEFLSWMGIRFCQILFLCLLSWSIWFLSFVTLIWGFSTSALLTFWAKAILCYAWCFVHCRMFNSIPCLYTLDARLWQQKCLQILPNAPCGGKITLNWKPLH